jgi:tetratricopeptide (TPR) repeat protein
VALFAVVALVVIIVYTQMSKPGEAGSSTKQSAPMQTGVMPSQAGPDMAKLASMKAAVEANPTDQNLLVQYGNALYDAAQWESAAEIYERYLKIAPRDADARVDMGIAYYQMGLASDSATGRVLLRKAIGEMKRANAGDPKHQASAFNLGIVFLQLGEIDSSNVWFNRTVALNKDSDLGVKAARILNQHSFSK